MKVLRPHDRFHIAVLPVHAETMKTTENAFNLLLCKYYSIKSDKLLLLLKKRINNKESRIFVDNWKHQCSQYFNRPFDY